MTLKRQCPKCKGTQLMTINGGAHVVGCDQCKGLGVVSATHEQFEQTKIDGEAIIDGKKEERVHTGEVAIPVIRRRGRQPNSGAPNA